MNKLDHINKDHLAALSAGELSRGDEESVRAHLDSCDACSAEFAGLIEFSQSLDAAWNAERLAALGLAHPTSADLESVWMGEADEGVVRFVKEHAATCEACASHLDRLEEGFAALDTLDPLGSQSWSASVSQRFAAGIEMVVEAANGAFTSAAGLVREVMTPQATSRLASTASIAMGHGSEESPKPWLWHDASFQTDEMSGEVNGSSDSLTGRGIIRVVIHKSGGFVGAQPMVDLINTSGTTVATQSALDMGDSFTASFANLDEGHYLVGIREPGS